MEKKNYIVGALWIMLYMLIGVYFEAMIAQGKIQDLMQSQAGHFLKSAHVHGGMFGMLNILYGFLAHRTHSSGTLINVGTWLAVVGALVFPVALFLAGAVHPMIIRVAPLGALSMIAAWGIMSYLLLTMGELKSHHGNH